MTLKIEGASRDETKIIDSINYTKDHTNTKNINEEIKNLKKTLYNIGYIETNEQPIVKKNDSSFFAQLQLKNKYSAIRIYFDDKTIDKAKLQKIISTPIVENYFDIGFQKVENTLQTINSNLVEQGYPFSKLKLSNIRVKNLNKLAADLIIESNQTQRTISNIKIKAYEKFPRSFIKHYLKIKPKQIFNLELIKKKTKQIGNLKFARQIKEPEVLFTKDSTTLYLYLEKAKSNTFDGFLGFGNNDVTNNIEFDGYVNLNLTNNLNYGESLKLLYKSDENDQETFQTDISLPYLFKSPIGLDLHLQIFKRDTSFLTINQSAKLHYQINPKHKVYGGLINETSNSLLEENISNTISNYESNFYSFAYEFLNPNSNDLLFPLNAKIYMESNFGAREQDNQIQNQSQFHLDAFKIFNLNKKNSFYSRINGSILLSKTYLENELFRFGGINSIRGFEENSLLGSFYTTLNTEYRYRLSRELYVNSVIDLAYFENKITDNKERLWGYGFGFGLITKAGLLKFNYANGKTQEQQFKLSNSKVHISLTTSF